MPGIRYAWWDKRGGRFHLCLEEPLPAGSHAYIPVRGALKSIKDKEVETLRDQLPKAIETKWPLDLDSVNHGEAAPGDATPPGNDDSAVLGLHDASDGGELDVDSPASSEGPRRKDEDLEPESSEGPGRRGEDLDLEPNSDEDLDAGTKRQKLLG